MDKNNQIVMSAARIRVKTDKKRGLVTPDWVLALAKQDPDSLQELEDQKERFKATQQALKHKSAASWRAEHTAGVVYLSLEEWEEIVYALASKSN